MKCFGILVCGVLLSVQGFAFKGVTGKVGNGARQLKELLRNQPLVEKVAAMLGESSVAINSGNLGGKIFSAAVGAGMLLAVTAADADTDSRAQALDKKIGSAKVIEMDGGFGMDVGGKLFGNFADYDEGSKADTFSGGIGINATLHRHLLALTLSGKVVSNNVKAIGAENYTGTEDFTGRAILVQGISIGHDAMTVPHVYAEAGGGQYGNNKRQADASAGVGLKFSRSLFGKGMELQVRSGLGGLWEGKYDGSDYADFDGDTVASFGAIVKTGWVSLGTLLGVAEEGSVLNYVPIIPNATTTYTQYHPVGDGDFSDPTRRLESSISIINGLGVTVEWNKKAGDDKAHKAILATLSYNIF